MVGEGSGFRIECRIPGADCNPYFTFAGLLAAGLEGIEKKIEPTEQTKGDLYSLDGLQTVPTNLEQAVEKFKHSEFARSSFGQEVVEHYSHYFACEIDAFNAAVTDWERGRYFEHI